MSFLFPQELSKFLAHLIHLRSMWERLFHIGRVYVSWLQICAWTKVYHFGHSLAVEQDDQLNVRTEIFGSTLGHPVIDDHLSDI